MIIDPSVLVAILRREPGAEAYAVAMAGARPARLSAASYVELAAVIDGRRDAALSGALDAVIRTSGIEIVPFTVDQARIARDAYRRFGRGSGHTARLNMGDCFAYALAHDLGEPLLFKGDDFTQTDIELITEPVRARRLSEVIAGYGRGTAGAGGG